MFTNVVEMQDIYLKEEFEDTNGVIIIRISKKKRQHNGKKKKYKRTHNDLQNIHIKTKDRITRTPLKPWVNSGAPEGKAIPSHFNSCSLYYTVVYYCFHYCYVIVIIIIIH